MRKCFYMHNNGVDFIMNAHNKRYITAEIALEFCNKIQNHFNHFTNISDSTLKIIQKKICLANYEIKVVENGPYKGMQYVNIVTDNGCFGCDPCENTDEFTLIWG